MANEVSTRGNLPSETSTTTSDDVKKAYDWRRRGRSLGWIMDHTEFTSVYEVAMAVKAAQIEEHGQGEIERQDAITLELARLDALQAEAEEIITSEIWIYNKDGDAIDHDYDMKLKAINTVLKISKQRVELLQLNQIDASAATATVLLVQGQTADYVASLKEIVQSDSTHK